MKKLVVLLWCLVFFAASVPAQKHAAGVPPRATGQTDVLKLACPPIDTVRIAFVGLGARGSDAVGRYMSIEGVKVVALCDLLPDRVDSCQAILAKHGRPAAAGYSAGGPGGPATS